MRLWICFVFYFFPPLFAGNPARAASQNHVAVNGWADEVFTGSIEEGLSLLEKTKKSVLLLKETRVHLEITGAALHAEVHQVFFNDTDQVLEVEYTFPLPSKATITGMQMVLDDRTITSVVQEKQAARATYREATRSGRQSILLEQDRPNIFTSKINRLEPGEEVVVSFTYLQALSFAMGTYKVVFPTTFGTRYFPQNWHNQPLDQSQDGEAQRRLKPLYVDISENVFSLNATILGLPLANVQSNTHNLYLSERGLDVMQVEIDPNDHRPNRDVVLELVLAQSQAPQSRLLQSVSAAGAHGLLQVFPPLGDLVDVETRPKEVIFLIDTSGSMMGVAMAQARQGLQACLNMLSEDDRFNIVAYDDEFQLFKHQAVDNEPKALQAALQFSKNLKADGGTELQPALAAVLNMPRSVAHLPWIVLLTDGDVGNETNLLKLVHKSEDQNRIFSFGMGSAPNRYLLTKLGEVGGGFATFVQPGVDLTQVMTQFFESVLAPVLTDVKVAFFHADGSKAEVDFLPGTPPDLYLDRPLQLCYTSDVALGGYATVKGEWQGQIVTYAVPIPTATPTHYAGVDKLFGKALLDELMVDYYLAGTDGSKGRVKADIVQTALAYQLVSQFTSRIAVSQERIGNAGPVLASVRVPLARLESHTYPATATQDWFWLGLGLFTMFMALGYGYKQRFFEN